MGAGLGVQTRGADQQAGRGVDLLAQLLDGGFQRATREAVEGGGGQGARGGDRQLGRLAAMGLGDRAQGARRMGRVLGQGREGVGAQGLDLGQGLLTRLQPRLGDQSLDLRRGEGPLDRLPGRGTHDVAGRIELGVEDEGARGGGDAGHVSRSTRRRRFGRPA
ncbi:hypothetical protein D3C81_1625250 [compost metagenome]